MYTEIASGQWRFMPNERTALSAVPPCPWKTKTTGAAAVLAVGGAYTRVLRAAPSTCNSQVASASSAQPGVAANSSASAAQRRRKVFMRQFG